MLKRILFAAAVTGLVAGVTLPLHSTAADAAASGCFKAAKAEFPGDHKSRVAYRKDGHQGRQEGRLTGPSPG